MSKARQVYLYSTFHTQRQLNVLYRNTSKRNIQRKNKDKVLQSKKIIKDETKYIQMKRKYEVHKVKLKTQGK